MLEFHDLIPLFIAFFIVQIKPGPEMLAFASMAIKGEWKSILIFWLGITSGATILYFTLLPALSVIPENFGIVFLFIKAFAAITFVFMGITGMQKAENVPQTEAKDKALKLSGQGIFLNFISGFFLALGNPYIIVFVATAIPAITNSLSFTLSDIILIRGSVIAIHVIVLSAYCIPLFILRQKMPLQYLQKIRFYASMAMVGIGVFLMGNIVLQFDLIQSNLIKVF